jgi:hypothetical protein
MALGGCGDRYALRQRRCQHRGHGRLDRSWTVVLHQARRNRTVGRHTSESSAVSGRAR